MAFIAGYHTILTCPTARYSIRTEAGTIDRAAQIVICLYRVGAARLVQIHGGARSGPDDALPCFSREAIRVCLKAERPYFTRTESCVAIRRDPKAQSPGRCP